MGPAPAIVHPLAGAVSVSWQWLGHQNSGIPVGAILPCPGVPGISYELYNKEIAQTGRKKQLR